MCMHAYLILSQIIDRLEQTLLVRTITTRKLLVLNFLILLLKSILTFWPTIIHEMRDFDDSRGYRLNVYYYYCVFINYYYCVFIGSAE